MRRLLAVSGALVTLATAMALTLLLPAPAGAAAEARDEVSRADVGARGTLGEPE